MLMNLMVINIIVDVDNLFESLMYFGYIRLCHEYYLGSSHSLAKYY